MEADRLQCAVFLDRDGVINHVVLKHGRPMSPRSLEEFSFLPYVDKALLKLKDLFLRLIVVTNQPDIARGKLSRPTLEAMTKLVLARLPLDDVFVCPHDDYHECSCRKPKPGMLLDAAAKWKIDLSRSFIIGDTWKDMEAGRRVGCTTILLRKPYNDSVASDYHVSSLKEVAGIIKEHIRMNEIARFEADRLWIT